MRESVTLRPGATFARVIKGGWQLAGGHGAFDRAEAVADMTRFLDAGITAFDCADIYTGVEEMIGDFIRGLRRNRGAEAADSVRVHTKLVPDLARLAVYSAADVEAIIDRSLARLGLDRLHLVQFYWWDLAAGDPVGVLGSLRRLQEKGKIEHVGTTNFNEKVMAKFADAGLDLATAQVQYSLLDARPAGAFASWCAGRDVKILCYGVLAGGFLTSRWLGAADPGHAFENRSLTKYRLIIDEFGGWDLFQDLLSTLARIATKHGAPLSAVASRWTLSQPGVGAAIIGARTAARLAETLQVFDLKLDVGDHAAIDRVLARRTGPDGLVYGLESDRAGKHGRIMKYNLGA